MTQTESRLYRVIAGAVVKVFKPLVRILLRHGISYQSCADWLRWCFVQVAHEEFTIKGRKQSKSRVAIITGITRVEVARQLQLKSPAEIQELETHQRASRVLAGWSRDPAFGNDNSEPLDLKFDGDSPNFSELVELYSGGTTPRAMLDELISVNAVVPKGEKLYQLVSQIYVPDANAAKVTHFEMLAHAANGLINTIAHNTEDDCEETWLQLQTYNQNIPLSMTEDIRKHIKRRSIEMIHEIDAYLYEKSPENLSRSEEVIELGLGMYLFQNEQEYTSLSKELEV